MVISGVNLPFFKSKNLTESNPNSLDTWITAFNWSSVNNFNAANTKKSLPILILSASSSRSQKSTIATDLRFIDSADNLDTGNIWTDSSFALFFKYS